MDRELHDLAVAARDKPTKDVRYTDGNVHRGVTSNEKHRLGSYCKDNPETIISLIERARKYEELIYAVSIKHPNESRHQTALRYIIQAETSHDDAAHCEKPPRD